MSVRWPRPYEPPIVVTMHTHTHTNGDSFTRNPFTIRTHQQLLLYICVDVFFDALCVCAVCTSQSIFWRILCLTKTLDNLSFGCNRFFVVFVICSQFCFSGGVLRSPSTRSTIHPTPSTHMHSTTQTSGQTAAPLKQHLTGD